MGLVIESNIQKSFAHKYLSQNSEEIVESYKPNHDQPQFINEGNLSVKYASKEHFSNVDNINVNIKSKREVDDIGLCRKEWPILKGFSTCKEESLSDQKKSEKKKKKCEKKKKKWARLQPIDLGFNMSILPFIAQKRCAQENVKEDIEYEMFKNYVVDENQNIVVAENDLCTNHVTNKGKRKDVNDSVSDIEYSTNKDVEMKSDSKKLQKCHKVALKYAEDETSDLPQYFWRHFQRGQLTTAENIFDFECLGYNQKLRQKRKWKQMKAHKQIKTKHCTSVHNGGHAKRLYIKHRIAKLMPMCISKYSSERLPDTNSLRAIDKRKGFPVGQPPEKNVITPIRRVASRTKHFPNQTVAASPYAMTAYNADGDLTANEANMLMQLQYRDLTPNDYEALLALDDRVKPKTASKNEIEALPTWCVGGVGNRDILGDACAVCMELFVKEQQVRELPCSHVYHVPCIDMWLSNSSPNCPLDGTPVFPS